MNETRAVMVAMVATVTALPMRRSERRTGGPGTRKSHAKTISGKGVSGVFVIQKLGIVKFFFDLP
jgi:hypothetical protein